jgi:hypothetical protein
VKPRAWALALGICVLPALSAAAQTVQSAPAARKAASVDTVPATPPAEGGAKIVAALKADRSVGDVEVRSSVDRSAIWVADRVTWSVEIVCRKGVDVLDEDMAKDKLKLEGLELVGGDTSRVIAADTDTTTHVFRYILTTYRVETPTLKISPLVVRFYVKRPGQRLEDAAPAGEVQVPGAAIAFRSLLPDAQENYAIRDRQPAAPRATIYALAQPVGLGLVVVSIAPAAFWIAALVRHRRTRGVHRSARKVISEERASLEAVRAMDVSTPDGRREAYARINTLVRDHLRDVFAVPGPSLTPAEIPPALAARGSRAPAEIVTELLGACEAALYAPPSQLPSAEACRTAIDQAEHVLSAR